jgi:hypothetical protein
MRTLNTLRTATAALDSDRHSEIGNVKIGPAKNKVKKSEKF